MTSVVHVESRLPATARDLKRKSLRTRTLNDFVEDVFLVIYDEPEFRKFITAVGNEDAVEGSMVADDLKAAEMIRDAAPEGSPVKIKKLWTIHKALNVVLRRYGVSRSEVSQLLGGEIVPNGNEIES
jgi:hypothetical protein